MPAFMIGSLNLGAPRGETPTEKVAQCSHAAACSQGGCGRTAAAIRRRRNLPTGYPQNLWISVWMSGAQRVRKRARNVTCSHWSFFDHCIYLFILNDLQAASDTSHLLWSSRCGRYENSSRV